MSNDPAWMVHAACSVLAGLALCAVGLGGGGLTVRRRNVVAVCGMALGGALTFGAVQAWDTLFDIHLAIAAAVNVPAQAALAVLAMLRLSGAVPAAPARTLADTTEAMRALLTRLRVPAFTGAFEDIANLFVWTAAVMQMLLLCDGRYREFPLSTFAVPALVTLGRLVSRDVPRTAGGREELAAGLVLAGAAVGSMLLEGLRNSESLLWNACAVLLAVPLLLRVRWSCNGGMQEPSITA